MPITDKWIDEQCEIYQATDKDEDWGTFLADAAYEKGYNDRHIEELETQDMLLNALGIRLQEYEKGKTEERGRILRELKGLSFRHTPIGKQRIDSFIKQMQPFEESK